MRRALESLSWMDSIFVVINLLKDMNSLEKSRRCEFHLSGHCDGNVKSPFISAEDFCFRKIEQKQFRAELTELENYQLLVDELSKSRSVLKHFLDASNALYEVYSSLLSRKLKRKLEEHKPTFPEGILGLPDEILGDIFEIVYNTKKAEIPEGQYFSDVLQTSVTLSCVCRRFRNVMLGLPRLWATISNLRTVSLNEMCLARSQNSSLEVLMHMDLCALPPAAEDAGCFLHAIKVASSRWQSLTITGTELQSLRLSLPLVATQLRFLVAPSLLKLEIFCLPNEHIDRIIPVVGEQDTYFYQTWSMPNLRSLRMNTGVQPISHFYPAFGRQLASVQLESLASISFEFDMTTLIEPVLSTCLHVLRHHPSLEEFIVKFHTEFEVPDLESREVIRLPNLSTLRMCFKSEATNGPESPQAMEAFMAQLEISNIKTLSLSFEDSSEELLGTWLDAIFLDNSYPTLLDFTIKNDVGHDAFNGPYEDLHLFERLPNLQHLSLLTPTITIRTSEKMNERPLMPHLKSLKVMPINSRDNGASAATKFLSRTFGFGGRDWSEFDGLELIQAPVWTAGASSMAIPTSKIKITR